MTDYLFGVLTGVGFGLAVGSWMSVRLERRLRRVRSETKAAFDEAILVRQLVLGEIERRANKLMHTFRS